MNFIFWYIIVVPALFVIDLWFKIGGAMEGDKDLPCYMVSCEGCCLSDIYGECKVFTNVPVYSFLCKRCNDKKTMANDVLSERYIKSINKVNSEVYH